jgi:hypothetical protein
MYVCIYFLESQVIAQDVKQMFVNFYVYAEFRMVNTDISLSLVHVYFIRVDGRLFHIDANLRFYVPKQYH